MLNDNNIFPLVGAAATAATMQAKAVPKKVYRECKSFCFALHTRVKLGLN